MRVAILPLNAAAGADPVEARQIAAFLAEALRGAGTEAAEMHMLARVEEEGQPTQMTQVNPSEELAEPDMIREVASQGQGQADGFVDGLLHADGSITLRWWPMPFQGEPGDTLEAKGSVLSVLREGIHWLADKAGATLNDEQKSGDKGLFGTENEQAFREFMQAYDTASYVNRAQGALEQGFDPHPALDHFLNVVEKDPEWDSPVIGFFEYVNGIVQLGIAQPNKVQAAMNRMLEAFPEDARVLFNAAEFNAKVGAFPEAMNLYERAARHKPEEPGIHARLGMAQMQAGMPANAERSFRRAVELEPDDNKPSLDLLANVLLQTQRAHEVPKLWQELVEKSPANGTYRAKLALAHHQAGETQQAKDVFEKGLEEVEEDLIIRRAYAPIVAQEGDWDRALDLYEDVLDLEPSDAQVLWEYANALKEAGREVDIPDVLRSLLRSNPDQDTQAITQAWLLELEQPKRAEAVENAAKMAEGGQFREALSSLEPLRNWLGDYWKLWATLAAIHNRLGEHKPAEEASLKLLEIYPGCEPAFGELCAALAGQDRHEDAYQFMRATLSRMQGSLAVAVNYALAAHRAGHTEEAQSMGRQLREATGGSEELKEVFEELGV